MSETWRGSSRDLGLDSFEIRSTTDVVHGQMLLPASIFQRGGREGGRKMRKAKKRR